MEDTRTLSEVLKGLFAPLLSVMILALGNGYFTTVSTLQLKHFHVPVWLIGVMAAVYFAGLMIGSYDCQRWIIRVGHIRAYAAFASLMTVSAILQGIAYQPILWGIWRFLCGYSLAGLYMVIEGWLLASSGKKYKGRAFAFYLFVFYIATALGQLFLKLPIYNILVIFVLVALLSSLSVLPVSLTKVTAPTIEQPEIISPLAISKQAPLGVVTCFCSGLVLGVIYGMLPLFFVQIQMPASDIAWLMLATILGGGVLQLPIGRYSDRVDRRWVLAAVCLITAALSVLFILFHHTLWLVFVFAFLFGGVAFTINPLGIGNASDYLDPKITISAISTLVLVYGAGSAIGPVVASGFIHFIGPSGLFAYMIVITLPLGLYAMWRVSRRPMMVAEQGQFQPSSGSAPVPPESIGEHIDE